MNKKIIICVMTILLLFITACGEAKTLPQDTTCEQVLNAAKQACAPPSNTTTYLKGQNDLDAYTMSLWADGMYAECAEFELLADYAVDYSSDNTTYEISVLKAKNENDAEKLSQVLERRKQTLSSGGKAAYDPDFNKLMDNSQILTEGEFVILLITPDNDAIKTAIESLKR